MYGASFKRQLDQEFYEHQLKGNTSVEQKVQCIDSLIKLRPERKYELLFDKARLLKDLGRFSDGIKIIEVLRKTVSENNPSEYLKITDEYAENLFLASRMSEAYTVSRNILSYEKPDSLFYYDFNALQHLRHIMMRLNMEEQWKKYNRMSMECVEKIKKHAIASDKLRKLLFRDKFSQASLLISEGKYEEAFACLKKALELSADDMERSNAYNGLGILFSQQHDYEKGRKYFKEALEKSRMMNKPVILFNYLWTYNDEGNKEMVMRVFEEARDMFESLDLPNRRELLRVMSELYRQRGDEENAAMVARQLSDVVDKEMSQRAELLDKVLKESETEADRLVKEEKRRTDMLMYCLIVAGIVIAMLSFYIVFSVKKRNKGGSGMFHCEGKPDYAAADGTQDNEMLSMSLTLARLHEALMEVKEEVCQLNKSNMSERTAHIKEILKAVTQQNNAWETFKVYFERSDKHFLENLYAICPSLTSAEIRICAFSRLGLTVKETAALTNRSIRTIESIRYTVRKKLAIKEQTDAYMRRVASMTSDEIRKESRRVSETAAKSESD